MKPSALYVAKVRNGFVARNRDEIFPMFKKLATPTCPFTNLPEKKASRWGEALTAEKMKETLRRSAALCFTSAAVDPAALGSAGALRHRSIPQTRPVPAFCRLCCNTATRSTTFARTRGASGFADGGRFEAFSSIISITAV
jgi:hypothetical protein